MQAISTTQDRWQMYLWSLCRQFRLKKEQELWILAPLLFVFLAAAKHQMRANKWQIRSHLPPTLNSNWFKTYSGRSKSKSGAILTSALKIYNRSMFNTNLIPSFSMSRLKSAKATKIIRTPDHKEPLKNHHKAEELELWDLRLETFKLIPHLIGRVSARKAPKLHTEFAQDPIVVALRQTMTIWGISK